MIVPKNEDKNLDPKVPTLKMKIITILMVVGYSAVIFFFGFYAGRRSRSSSSASVIVASADVGEMTTETTYQPDVSNVITNPAGVYKIPIFNLPGINAQTVDDSSPVTINRELSLQYDWYLTLEKNNFEYGIGSWSDRVSSCFATGALHDSDPESDATPAILSWHIGNLNSSELVRRQVDFSIYVLSTSTIDWSSFDEYFLYMVQIKTLYFGTDLDFIRNTLGVAPRVFTIVLWYQIGEDNTNFVELAIVPTLLYQQQPLTDEITTYDCDMFYVSNSNVRVQQTQISQDYYDVGYQIGYDNGKLNTETIKTSDAYKAGYEKGYAAGNASGNDLRSVIVAGIETPVNMFREMTNWSLLGFNLFGIFTALLTVIVIVFLIKKLK